MRENLWEIQQKSPTAKGSPRKQAHKTGNYIYFVNVKLTSSVEWPWIDTVIDTFKDNTT